MPSPRRLKWKGSKGGKDVIAETSLGDAADVDPSKKELTGNAARTLASPGACSGAGSAGSLRMLALYRGFDADVRSRAPSRNASSRRVGRSRRRGREAFYGFPGASLRQAGRGLLMTCAHRPKGRDVRARVLAVGRARRVSARRFPALRKKLEVVGDVASEKYEAAKDSLRCFWTRSGIPARDCPCQKSRHQAPFRPQSRPTSSNDAFEGQVDFAVRQR